MKRIYFLTLTSFFMISCSNEESIKSIDREYNIDLNVSEIGNKDPERIPDLNEKQVKGLLTYVESYQQHALNDFEVLNSIDGADVKSYTIQLDIPETEINDYELTRIIRFDINNSDNEFRPQNVTASLNGEGGVEWITQVSPNVNITEDFTSIEVAGDWQAEFIYNDELVTFVVADTWEVAFNHM